MTDIFREVRERVSAQDAARRYGVEMFRGGRARCPFHSPDKHPSMSFKGPYFRCWSCGEHGDAVDLVGKLCGLDALGAVRRLNDEFHLDLPLDRQQTPQERTEAGRAAAKRRELSDAAQEFEAWRSALLDKLTAVFRLAHFALKDCRDPDGLSQAEVMAIQWEAAVEDWADTLITGTMARQMEIFRDRKAVTARCDRILRLLRTRSNAA